MNHTKGPLTIRKSRQTTDGGRDWAIYDSDGKIIAECFNVVWYGNDTRPAEANARLMSAAPDLLEACQEAESWFDWYFNDDPMGNKPTMAQRMHEAIQKATGEKP